MVYVTILASPRARALIRLVAPRGETRVTNEQSSSAITCADEHTFTLRQADQARGDLYAIADDIEFLKVQLARLPTRQELAHLTRLAALTGSALVLAAIEALFR